MSTIVVEEALGLALAAIDDFETEWPNTEFEAPGTPYQKVLFLRATPENPVLGRDFMRLRGIMQVTLKYFTGTGDAAVMLRAKNIQDAFPKGRTLEKDGVRVTISTTPAIASAIVDGDRYCVPISVPYYSDILLVT